MMAIGRIRAKEDKGSGFALAPRIVVTADHVVRDEEESSLVFVLNDGRGFKVKRVERDETLDIAVLHMAEDVPEVLSVGPAREGLDWRVESQPLGNDPLLTGTIDAINCRLVNKEGHELRAVQLWVKQELGDYAGYSGSAVALKSPHDVVFGVLVEQVPLRVKKRPGERSQSSANVLWVVPIQEVLKRFDLDEVVWVPVSPVREERKPGQRRCEDLGRLPPTDPNVEIVGREERLKQLDDAWNDPIRNVVSLVASGGVGKSALINKWLRRLGEDFGGADSVFAWSFYNQGVTDQVISADSFIEEALRCFDDPNPNEGTHRGKGVRLADCIVGDPQKPQKPLLIIDGLEPLQYAPYPPGPNAGKLRDDSLRALLVRLAAHNPGLCIISTRVAIPDLRQFEGESCLRIDLENLSKEAGAALLRSQGVNGAREEELEGISIEFGGHALALTLLGSYLKQYGGDILHRSDVHLLAEAKDRGVNWEDVMRTYEGWFGEEAAELSVWRLFGLFDRPVDERLLWEFLISDPIYDLTDTLRELSGDEIRSTTTRLSSLSLLSQREDPKQPRYFTLDAHPLIREYFGEQLKRSNYESWCEGNDRLSKLYVQRYKDAPKEYPSIKDMEPLFQAVTHACKASRHHEALHQIYLPHIMREDEGYAEYELGAVGALLTTLSHFFEEEEEKPWGGKDWGKPVRTLSESDQLLVLTDAGRYLTQIKGYAASEVGDCYVTAATLSDETKDPRRFFEARLGLSRYYRVRGQFEDSYRESTNLEARYKQLEESQPETVRSTLRPTVFPAIQRALATYHYYKGNFSEAKKYARKGAVRYSDPKQALLRARLDVNEPSILCLSYQAAALWCLGKPDQALKTSTEAVNRANDLGHAHTLAIALLLDAMVHHFRRDPNSAMRSAKTLIDLCAKQGFTLWRISGEILHAWSLAHTAEDDQGILDDIKQNISQWKYTEAQLFVPYWYALLAETCLRRGEPEEGLAAVKSGLEPSDEDAEQWWDAELHRLNGELLLRQSQAPMKAEESFKRAFYTARAQNAKSLELRAAISLARVQMQQNREEDTRRSLEKIYRSFPTDLETEDLKDARQLLDNLQ